MTSTTLWPVPPQLLASVASTLQAHGVAIAELLNGSGLSEADLFKPERLIPYRTTQKILQRAVELSPIPHLGLAVGASQSPSSMGILGHAINSCASVEDALELAVKYFRVSSTLLNAQWEIVGQQLLWTSSAPIDLGTLLPCVVEEELLTLVRSYQMVTGHPLVLIAAYFEYPKPAYAELYYHYFGCPVFFEADKNQIVMDTSILQDSILQANSVGAVTAERMCDDFLASHPENVDFAMLVRQLIYDPQGNYLSEATVAQKLNITPRTLRNRLQRVDTNFQLLADELKFSMAKKELSNSAVTIDQLADLTGYSDARSFRRAFKAWSGISPSEYRQQHAQANATPTLPS